MRTAILILSAALLLLAGCRTSPVAPLVKGEAVDARKKAVDAVPIIQRADVKIKGGDVFVTVRLSKALPIESSSGRNWFFWADVVTQNGASPGYFAPSLALQLSEDSPGMMDLVNAYPPYTNRGPLASWRLRHNVLTISLPLATLDDDDGRLSMFFHVNQVGGGGGSGFDPLHDVWITTENQRGREAVAAIE